MGVARRLGRRVNDACSGSEARPADRSVGRDCADACRAPGSVDLPEGSRTNAPSERGGGDIRRPWRLPAAAGTPEGLETNMNGPLAIAVLGAARVAGCGTPQSCSSSPSTSPPSSRSAPPTTHCTAPPTPVADMSRRISVQRDAGLPSDLLTRVSDAATTGDVATPTRCLRRGSDRHQRLDARINAIPIDTVRVPLLVGPNQIQAAFSAARLTSS